MKLTNVAKLIFSEINKQECKHTHLSETLGIWPQNLTIWEKDQNIPIKHIGTLRKELGISKQRLVKALRLDFEEATK